MHTPRTARLLDEVLSDTDPDPWTPPRAEPPRSRMWVDGTTRWLEHQPWDHFITLTYGKYAPSAPAARRHVERFLQLAPIKLAWWVTERGEKFGRIHNHALVQWRTTLLGDEEAASYWDAWWRARNGHVDFRAYDPDRGAAGYLDSYVTKAVCDYDIWLPKQN